MNELSLLKRKSWTVGLLGLAIVAVLVWAAVLQQPDGKLHFWVLDVGQGDALLIETPHGRTVLVDGGPDPLVLERQLGAHLPFWRRTIDLMVLTHPHADHITGLVDVLNNYHVGAVLETSYSGATSVENEWRSRLAAHNLTPTLAQEGQEVDVEPGVALRVEYPEAKLPADVASDINNASVVLRMTYGTVNMLLTGDIETEAVNIMLHDAAQNKWDLRSQVLKVPHHGSATGLSADFLKAVQPGIALISVGAGNTYGHPAPATLDLLQKAGVPVLRTDQNGSIEVVSDGQQLWVAAER